MVKKSCLCVVLSSVVHIRLLIRVFLFLVRVNTPGNSRDSGRKPNCITEDMGKVNTWRHDIRHLSFSPFSWSLVFET